MESSILAVPFIVNGLMSLFKWAGGLKQAGNPGMTGKLRFAAILLSLLGVFVSAWISGNAVDINTVTDLVKAGVETVVIFLAAHGGYDLVASRRESTI